MKHITDEYLQQWVAPVWEILSPGSRKIPMRHVRSIDRFLGEIGPDNVEDAAEIAFNRGFKNINDTFRYFAGICWHMIRTEEDIEIDIYPTREDENDS